MKSWHAGVFVASMLAPSIVFAQERVTLADGTVMQGELVEKVPGDHITLKLATGEIRTITWSALAPQMQAPPPVVMQQQAQVPTGPTTHVAIDADAPGVSLMRVMGFGFVQYGSATGSFASYQTVCVAPCQADVDANATYQISGDGVTPSSPFTLPTANGAPVRLHVHGGSLGARIGGLWLVISGITFAVTGGVLAGTFAALSSSSDDTTGWIVAGLVTAGVGVVMTVLGIPLVSGSGTTVVTDQNVTVAHRNAPKIRFTPTGFVF
jgi:hypothetical protein